MVQTVKLGQSLNILKWSLVGILILVIFEVSAVPLEEDLTLSHRERLTLDKFRRSVESQLPHEYMKTDIYLVRWLRARNFDINLAKAMLLDNLEWRRKNKMDTIHEEDWTEYEARYPFWFDGVDKEGRPIAFLNAGSYDLRQAVVSGERDKLMRYVDRCVDLAVLKLRRMQDEGQNISQLNFIVNMKGYNVALHGCLQCTPIYLSFVSTYELRYPGVADKIILVNTPSVFQVVLSALQPVLSPGTRESLKVLGTNKNKYMPILFKDIEKDQLPREVGGTDDGTLYPGLDDTDYNGFP